MELKKEVVELINLLESKFKFKLNIIDLSSPELVKAYIEKHELCSANAEMIISLLQKKLMRN